MGESLKWGISKSRHVSDDTRSRTSAFAVLVVLYFARVAFPPSLFYALVAIRQGH